MERRSRIELKIEQYGAALLLPWLATALSLWLLPSVDYSRSIFFIVVIVISSWLGGLGPGLLATVSSTLLFDYFLLPPYRSITSFSEDFVQIVIFVGVSAFVAYLTSAQRRAERLAREADRRKDAFLSILAHELRGPLSMVSNGAQILKLAGDNPEIVARQQKLIERQAAHMANIMNDLLELTRIAQGKFRAEMTPLDLRQIVEDAIEQNQDGLEAHRHTLSYEPPATPVGVMGDPTRLRQVASNLLTNAIKYTEDGGRIEIRLETETSLNGTPRAQAVLSVSDTGIGLAPELLPRLFTLYTQSDQALGRAKGGLGIGLSLVHGLVASHGGTIEAHSPGVGQGSRFVVRLPLLAPEAAPQAGDALTQR